MAWRCHLKILTPKNPQTQHPYRPLDGRVQECKACGAALAEGLPAGAVAPAFTFCGFSQFENRAKKAPPGHTLLQGTRLLGADNALWSKELAEMIVRVGDQALLEAAQVRFAVISCADSCGVWGFPSPAQAQAHA